MRITKSNKGFTLFEVILAISIISVSLAGLLQAYVMIDHSRVHCAQYTQALFLQELKLQDILNEENVSRSKDKGIFDPPFEQFHWEADQGVPSKNGFRDIHLTVLWMEQDQAKEISLSTYARKKNATETKE